MFEVTVDCLAKTEYIVVCPLVVLRGLPGEDLFRLSFTTKCFVVFWDPDIRQSLILILPYSFTSSPFILLT